jgi:hypothetical protein
MGAQKLRFVTADMKLDPKHEFRSDDALVSKGDLALSGCLLRGVLDGEAEFAARLFSLGQVVTRVVLSERMIFYGDIVDTPRPAPNYIWSDTTEVALREHCNVLVISESHPVFAHVPSLLGDPLQYHPDKLIEDVGATVSLFAPWTEKSDMAAGETATLARAFLTEHAIADLIGLPVALNPIISTPFGAHAARRLGSAAVMVRYVEDLRREVAQEVNLLEEMELFDLRVPAIFGAVLREARDPGELLTVAAAMSSDAANFRAWCRSLDELTTIDPKRYHDKLKEAQSSLHGLEGVIKADGNERLQVSIPSGLGTKLSIPSETLKRWMDWLDVDMAFVRPRHFLRNLVHSARQVASLDQEVARVFDTPKDFARNATRMMLDLADAALAPYVR